MSSSFVNILAKYRQEFHQVVPFDKTTDKLLPLDFTAANKKLSADILNNTGKFSVWIDRQLKKADARYGIGGYGEHRTVYSVSKIFDADKPGEEPRRLHLGVDIWGKAGTVVMAPMDGIVHSFAFNNRFGDYGATIILSHQLEETVFYTLYGHLSLAAIKNLKEADKITGGDVFAEFGNPEENGCWPPHLHLQIIEHIDKCKGDYQGVCKFSEKEKWLANSPDPDTILCFGN